MCKVFDEELNKAFTTLQVFRWLPKCVGLLEKRQIHPYLMLHLVQKVAKCPKIFILSKLGYEIPNFTYKLVWIHSSKKWPHAQNFWNFEGI